MEENPRVKRVLKAIEGLRLGDIKLLAFTLWDVHPSVAGAIADEATPTRPETPAQ